MKSRERLLRIIKGQECDRAAWSPFLAYWWESQGSAYQKKGEIQAIKEMGGDPLIRGHIPWSEKTAENLFMYDIVQKGCEITEKICGDKKQVIYETKAGTLTAEYKCVQDANTWFLIRHPIKNPEDFKILQYICEHTELKPNYERFLKEQESAGEEALLVPVLVPELKTDFQSLVEYWVGTEELVYALADEPELVEETLAVMHVLSEKAVEISVQSPAEVFLSWEDSSTTNYSPAYYEAYILPQIKSWCDILHRNNKYYIQHACGHLAALAPLIEKSGIDCLESISPPPTGNIRLEELAGRISRDLVYIGGIEPVFFLNASKEEVVKEAERLLACMKDKRFILANSDSCPPGVELEKFKAVGALLSKGK